MVWVKLDDSALTSPSWLELPRAARLLHLEALSWSNRHGANGVIPRSARALITDEPEAAAMAGLLVDVGRGSSPTPAGNSCGCSKTSPRRRSRSTSGQGGGSARSAIAAIIAETTRGAIPLGVRYHAVTLAGNPLTTRSGTPGWSHGPPPRHRPDPTKSRGRWKMGPAPTRLSRRRGPECSRSPASEPSSRRTRTPRSPRVGLPKGRCTVSSERPRRRDPGRGMDRLVCGAGGS